MNEPCSRKADSIYGDGVNIAARAESLTDPCGICVTRAVVDQVEKRVDAGFDCLGEYRVKNAKGDKDIEN